MRNNQLDKVKLDTGKLPRSRFNKSFDVNTTADWGFCQPSICQMMYPNTKQVVQSETLVRLAPMLAPTFGRVAAKQYHQFVDIEDIYPPFPNLMSQTAYNGTDSRYVPNNVPRVPLAWLSLFVLTGAKCTLYQSAASLWDTDTSAAYTYNYLLPSGLNTNAQNFVDAFKFYYDVNYNGSSSTARNNLDYLPFDYQGPTINVSKLLPAHVQTAIRGMATTQASYNQMLINRLPLGNANDGSFFRDVATQPVSGHSVAGFDSNYVTIESADIVIPITFTGSTGTNYYGFAAFRLSDMGKRIRKILIGCGYQVDIQSLQQVSILPLMAYFKAYYDLFGLTSKSNYSDTELAGLVSHICANNYTNAPNRMFYSTASGTSSMNISFNYYKGFILSLADCWYTENQDYLSAHQSDYNYSMSPHMAPGSVVDDLGVVNVGTGVSAQSSVPIIDIGINTKFTQVDVELLKKMYRWVNNQSIAGKQIAAALRAQGFSSYVDSCKSNFIGSSEQFVTINDVVSTSDTYDDSSKSGSILGEYGGKGIGYDNAKPLTFETDKFGYWIGMFTIVPKSGYNQGIDGTLLDTEKYDFHNPEFDGLGYQATPDDVVFSAVDFVENKNALAQIKTFGFIPRYSEWKVGKNINNGDFSLRGTRNTYQPYCLDKELPVGERMINSIVDGGSGLNDLLTVNFTKIFPLLNVPSAGDTWRFVGRYPWIGTLNRIFANFGSDNLYNRVMASARTGVDYLMPIVNSYDNFLVHMINNVQCYAPMKPIEESFGTDDDGSFDSSVDKA